MIAAPHIPGYAQGLARHRGESACPGLWDGLVGLWAPSLGPTGRKVVDWSGRGNDGVFGPDMGLDSWVVLGGSYVLDYDGTDDYVDTGVARLAGTGLYCGPSERFTAVVVGRTNVTRVGTYLARGGGGSEYRTFDIRDNGTDVVIVLRGAELSCWSSDNAWHQYAVTWDGTGATAYRDALDVVSPPVGAADEQGGQRIIFGARANGGGYRLNGQIALVAIWNRVLGPTEIREMSDDRYRLLRPRHRPRGMLPAIGGPYGVAARQAFLTGTVAGALFCPGVARGEAFNTGSILGECHGRSG